MNYKELSDFANTFLCSYRFISSVDDPIIPTNNQELDRSIKHIVDKKQINNSISRKLHFSDSRKGLVCIELENILLIGNNLGLITPTDPDYLNYKFLISKNASKKILDKYDMYTKDNMEKFVKYLLRDLTLREASNSYQ